MLSTRNLICSTNSSSVTLWSFAEVLFDQYVVPSLLITMYFAPLILYASLISWPMLPRSKSCGMFVYRVEKSKLSKCHDFYSKFPKLLYASSTEILFWNDFEQRCEPILCPHFSFSHTHIK